MDYYVGVDVGTGSARAALVSSTGKILKMTTCPLEIFHPAPNFYEQSSDNIWSAVCHVVKVLTSAGLIYIVYNKFKYLYIIYLLLFVVSCS